LYHQNDPIYLLPAADLVKKRSMASGFSYLGILGGHIQIAFLPPYAPDINLVEYLWTWLKRNALANCCSSNLAKLHITARNKLKSAQKRPSIIAACWKRATFW